MTPSARAKDMIHKATGKGGGGGGGGGGRAEVSCPNIPIKQVSYPYITPTTVHRTCGSENYVYRVAQKKTGTAYFPQYVDAITDITVRGNLSRGLNFRSVVFLEQIL